MDDVYLVTAYDLATIRSFNARDHVDLMEFFAGKGCVPSKHLHLLEVPLEVLEEAVSLNEDLHNDLVWAEDKELDAVLYHTP